jgi:hypothetical protein
LSGLTDCANVIPANRVTKPSKHKLFIITSAGRQCSGGGSKQKAVDRRPPLIEPLSSPHGITNLAVTTGHD